MSPARKEPFVAEYGAIVSSNDRLPHLVAYVVEPESQAGRRIDVRALTRDDLRRIRDASQYYLDKFDAGWRPEE